MIIFKNKGLIDPILLNSFGVSVKETDNPIGKFGTGLKYAIATLLRKGIKIKILSGRDCIKVSTIKREVRGKTFNFVAFNDEISNFATNLGKDWELWEAYRELYSNCLDENGEVFISDNIIPEDNFTQVIIDNDEFEDIYLNNHKYFLNVENKTPLFSYDDIEIYDGEGSCIFYKGVKATNDDNFKSKFTYNINCHATITENRRFEYPEAVKKWIIETIISCNKINVIKQILSLNDNTFCEYDFDFNTSTIFANTSREFITAVTELDYDGLLVNKSAKERIDNEKPLYEKLDICTEKTLTPRGANKLVKIQSSLNKLFDGRLKVKVVNSLKGYGNVFFSQENNTFYIYLEHFLLLNNNNTTTKAFIKRAIIEYIKYNSDEIETLIDALPSKYLAKKVKLERK